jgi:hypothetical protein
MGHIIVIGECSCRHEEYEKQLIDVYGRILLERTFCTGCNEEVVFHITEKAMQEYRNRENAKENKSGENKDKGAVHKD